MTKRIVIRPKASQDLDDHFAHIAENNSETALQFFDSTRLTIAQLARMPGIGSRVHPTFVTLTLFLYAVGFKPSPKAGEGL